MKFILLKIIPLVIVIGILSGGIWYRQNIWFGIPADSPRGKYNIQIKSGDNLEDLAKRLEQDKVIYDANWLPLVAKATVNPSLRAGNYVLDLPAAKTAILQQLQQQNPASPSNSSPVSLLEGDTAEDIADKLGKSGIVKAEEFLKYIQDPINFQNSAYPFLPPVKSGCRYGEILQNCPKYYLEGYLYPDTYEFFLESTPEKVVDKLLLNYQKKVWAKLSSRFTNGDEANRVELYTKVILASVVEREVGRNNIKALINDTDLQSERYTVAGVYLNRLQAKIKWQADPTVWYGVDRKRGVAIDGALNWGDPKYNTKYNTYVSEGYPVGPIANPGIGSLEAAIKPQPSEYLFFVSDRSGKMYFAKTNQEHEQNKTKVREINRSLPSL